jgi:hypothetical protein
VCFVGSKTCAVALTPIKTRSEKRMYFIEWMLISIPVLG